MEKGGNAIQNIKDNIQKYTLDEHILLWLREWNKYIITNSPADIVVPKILEGQSSQTIINYCVKELRMSEEEAFKTDSSLRDFINNIKAQYNSENIRKPKLKTGEGFNEFYSRKYYFTGKQTFQADYPNAAIENLIHPKFKHLEIHNAENIDCHLQVVFNEDLYSLFENGMHIGSWERRNEHFLSGKFSMRILQKIYNKKENEWIGVFHAAGVTDGNNCLMFLGDSGNGKSTLSSILLANGLDVLADDFLPLEATSNKVCRFPSAISVKKDAYSMVSGQFPEIENAEEYNNPLLNKTFRYLPIPNNELISVPCKALIFIKYNRNVDFKFEEITHVEAFQQLVPDSWISPEPLNARQFIDWFKSLPCYRLSYSDNEKMINKVKALFRDELS